MYSVLSNILIASGLCAITAIALGRAFDLTASQRYQAMAVGFACGAVAALLPFLGPYGPVALAPPLVAAGILAGRLAVLMAVPLPLALIALQSGGLIAWLTLAASASLGLVARFLSARMGAELDRSAALWGAIATPFACAVPCLAAVSATPVAALRTLAQDAAFAATVSAVLIAGIVSEIGRSETNRKQRQARKLRMAANLVSPAMFQAQVLHQWRLHEFFGAPHAFILVSIDRAAELRRSAGEANYERIREEVGRVVGSSTRQVDLATAVDFDRFAILLPQTSVEVARGVAIRLQNAVREAVSGPFGAVTVSMGLADADDATTPDGIEDAAEAALYEANARQASNAIGAGTLTTHRADRQLEAPRNAPGVLFISGRNANNEMDIAV